MDIIEKIINVANILDDQKHFAEADQLTKIAANITKLKLAAPINLNQQIGNQNRENNTQTRIKNTLEETSNLKMQAPIQASDDDEDDKREAGFTSLTTLKNDQLNTNKTNKQIGKTVDTIERLKSSSTNRNANMVNLTGIMNQQKQTNFMNKEIGRTVQKLDNMKAYSEKDDSKEKTGERDDKDDDKEAISLTTLPTQQKQQNSMQNNIQRSINRVDRMKQDRP